MSKLKNLGITMQRGLKSYWKKYHFLVPPKVLKKNLTYLARVVREKAIYYNPYDKKDYNKWLKKAEKPVQYEVLKYQPLISVLLPVYNVEPEYLRECVDSILTQSYENFEICIVDDKSTNPATLMALKEFENHPKIRVKYRKENGHISVATDDALEMAKGEFIALMDDDDMLAREALYEVVKVLNENRKLDFIYTDEDKIDMSGVRCDPHLKPDFSLDSLYSSNYISHLGVIRVSIVREVGGFREGFEGAQDYDLYLRVVEKIMDKEESERGGKVAAGAKRIYHIPKILYHWRMIPGSTAAEINNKNYALERGRKAIVESLERRKIKGEVKIAKDCPYYYIEYEVKGEPKVSIIIPTRDLAETLGKCLKSIYEKTMYQNYEVIVIDNGSVEPGTLKLFEKYKKKHQNFCVIRMDQEFNYAALNNEAVRESGGEYVVLLNNDIEVITPNWLEIMMGYAAQPHVGAVGAKLLYGDGTVQHAGVILGLGVASHAFGGANDTVVWGGRLSVPYNYSAMTAACLMVAREKWDEVDGLEEKLKVTYNDVDFCLKLLEKGYYNVLVPMVKMYHYESKSRGVDDTPEKKARFDWEQEYMYKKWGERIRDDIFYNPNFSRQTWYMLDRDGVVVERDSGQVNKNEGMVNEGSKLGAKEENNE